MAMRTMSIARTTPAQKPRGFSRRMVFSSPEDKDPVLVRLEEDIFPFSIEALTPICNPLTLTQLSPDGQRKPLKQRQLALSCHYAVANGKRHFALKMGMRRGCAPGLQGRP